MDVVLGDFKLGSTKSLVLIVVDLLFSIFFISPAEKALLVSDFMPMSPVRLKSERRARFRPAYLSNKKGVSILIKEMFTGFGSAQPGQPQP